MATYTYPGVYIQEVPKGPSPIQAVSASTCAMVGFTEEGATDQPVLVTSFPEFTSTFGSFTSKGRLPTAAFAYFQNGGQNLVVVRTVGSGAASASAIVAESKRIDTQAPSPATDNTTKVFSISISETPIVPSSIKFKFNALDYIDNGAGSITQGGVSKGTVDYQSGVISLTVDNAPAAGQNVIDLEYDYANLTFNASSEGAWGNDLRVILTGDDNSVNSSGNYTLYIVTVQRKDADGNYVDIEVFSGVTFGSNDATFIEGIVNDSRRGSDLVSVVASSQATTPTSLTSLSVNKTVHPTQALDGTETQFNYTVGEAIKSETFTGEVLIGDEMTVTVGAQTLNQDGTNANVPVLPLIRVESGEASVRAKVTTTAGATEQTVSFVQGANDAISMAINIDDGAGNTFDGTLTVEPLTGHYELLRTGGADTVATIVFTYFLKDTLSVKDDGTGELVIDGQQDNPTGVSLHPNGVNDIATATGAFNLNINLAVNGNFQAARGPALFDNGTVKSGQVVVTYQELNTDLRSTNTLANGADGSGLLRSNVSAPNLAGSESGMYALNKTDALLNVCIPDFASDMLVSQDLVDYCETRKDRFAILSVPEGFTYTEAIDYKRNTLLRNSNRASIYYPHLKIVDPVTDNEVNFPAVAHMAGIYARTDSARNVSKAPAGTVDGRISFALGLEVELTPQQAGFVNSAHVNNLVSWPFTGLVSWGARTLEPNGDFPYIQMRRLFMFVEKSVFNSTQGFVFESNTAGLRAAIKLQIEAFLLGLHRTGHFAGVSPAQSFFCICDSSNNPQNMIDQGHLVVDVGIAPTKPAEFVIFRFQQKTIE